MEDLWRYKPVQNGLKSFAAGTAVCAAMWAFNKVSRVFTVSESARQDAIKALFPVAFKTDLDDLAAVAPEFLDLLGRLEPFRRFDPAAFDKILCAVVAAAVPVDLKNASSSFAVRLRYQKIIEAIRFFRSILEQTIESALEDFDDVAVDLNARVEQACQDSIMDTYM